MNKELLTIQEAATITGKSVQTIRRAIKSKKLKTKREKTPQGFNYLINQETLFSFYKIKNTTKENVSTKQATNRTSKRKNDSTANTGDAMSLYIKKEEMGEFHKTLQKIIHDHTQERQNYLRLVQALQEKLVALENQFKLLQEAGKKKWFQIWK